MTTSSSTDATPAVPPGEDPVIYRDDFRKRMNNVTSETVRVWIKDGKIPKPDVGVTLKTRGWKASTLRAAGLPF